MQTVIETGTYLAHAKRAGLTDEERHAIIAMLAVDPTAGDLMKGTGGARKVRVAREGSGKSGGYRVITYLRLMMFPCSSSIFSGKVRGQI